MKDLTNIRHALEKTQAELTKKTSELLGAQAQLTHLENELAHNRRLQETHVCPRAAEAASPASQVSVPVTYKNRKLLRGPTSRLPADARATTVTDLIAGALVGMAAFALFVWAVKLLSRS